MAKRAALEMLLLKRKSRARTRLKTMLLETSTARRNPHLMTERSRQTRFVRMRAGRDILPTNSPSPRASLESKTVEAPAAQPSPT